MRVDQAERRLRAMLQEAGLDPGRLQPDAAWAVFKAFASEPVEGVSRDDHDDMCLFECGVYDWSDGNGPRFSWGLTRQFTLYDEDGDYDHMEQLHCTVFFDATPQLHSVVEDAIWSGADIDEWAAEVELTTGFRAVAGIQPIESRVEQEHV